MEDELHGIFKFTEDIFVSQEKKVRHFTAKRYTPEKTLNGSVLEHTSVESEFKQTIGPALVLESINYLYYSQDFKTCLAISDKFINANSSLSKPLNLNEVLEIACRCCIRMNNIDDCNNYLLSIECNNPGLIFFKAHVFRLLGRTRESVQLLMKYLETREDDYSEHLFNF